MEAEGLVEHVFQVRGFEIGGQPLLIAPPEPRAQQGGADPVSLPDRIDPDECQIPMRLFARMGGERHGLILRDDDETTAEGPHAPWRSDSRCSSVTKKRRSRRCREPSAGKNQPNTGS